MVEILIHIMAVSEERKGPAFGAELQLVVEIADGFAVFPLLDEVVDDLGPLAISDGLNRLHICL